MIRLTIIIIGLLFTCTSCHSYLTGNGGRFTFAYRAASNVLDFNKPIAPGAKLDILARSLGSNEEIAIASATSSNPDVLTITEIGPTHVTVQGATVGTARLTIRTDTGLEDSVDLHVARPESMKLLHSCTDEAFAVYPANSRIAIPFGLGRGDGQSVAGYGFWPIRVTPKRSLTLDRESRDQGALHFQTAEARHRVAIRSTIDDTILGLALAENHEVDGIGAPTFVPRLSEGEEALIEFSPRVGGVAFCQATLRTQARSLTPKHCDASARVSEDSIEENNLGLVRIVAKSYGICEFEVRFPEAQNGEGIARQVRVAIGKFPSLDAAHSDDTPPPAWLAPVLALIAPLLLLPLAVAWRKR